LFDIRVNRHEFQSLRDGCHYQLWILDRLQRHYHRLKMFFCSLLIRERGHKGGLANATRGRNRQQTNIAPRQKDIERDQVALTSNERTREALRRRRAVVINEWRRMVRIARLHNAGFPTDRRSTSSLSHRIICPVFLSS
jgi:hypothetical protein